MSIENENELEPVENENEAGEPTPAPELDSEETPVEEYTPNFNYSVLGEDKEFDEELRGSITSKDTEEKLRDLYTRSAGLDTYKNKYGELEGQTQALVQGFQTLKQLRDNKDVRGLMKSLNVDEEVILDYASSILDERELPEEHRTILEENRQMREQMSTFEKKLGGFEEQASTTRVDDDLRELQSMIISDDVKPVAKAMESVGINMQEEVLKEGHMEYLRTNQEPSIGSVVKKISQKYNYLTQQSSTKPTLPKVGGSNNIPVGQKITSIDDLRKLVASQV
jgi:hypothetical protein